MRKKGPCIVTPARLLLLALAVTVPAGALAFDPLPNCRGIKIEKERVECQAVRRRRYGEALERKLSAHRPDIRVFVQEVGDPGIGGYPRVIVWDRLTFEQVKSLNEQARIPDGARAVGFKTLVYVDKGESNNWYFDLTRPGSAPLDFVPPKLPWLREQDGR